MKSKILLLTTMLTSAGFAFAQTETVERYGISFELLEGDKNVEIIEGAAPAVNKEVSYQFANNDGIKIENVTKYTYTNQTRNVNVRAKSILDRSKTQTSGKRIFQITSWTAARADEPKSTKENYNAELVHFGKPAGAGGTGTNQYEVYPDMEEYKTYEKVCLIAANSDKMRGMIVKGSTIDTEFDKSNAVINRDLYYYAESRFEPYILPNGKKVYEEVIDYTPIKNTSGGVFEETEYKNCFDTYYPTEISDEIEMGYTKNGKVGVVTGVVNNARIEETTARGERNFDFTGALVLGRVNVDVPSNKLAYFSSIKDEETESSFIATGTNVVKGALCANYLIKDNGEEIYVKNGFTATKATYERNFSAGTYGTLVLPFKAENTSVIFERQGRFTGYDPAENKISCTLAETMSANVPYLIQISTDATEISEVNVNVQPTGAPKSGTFNNAQFIGTFQPISGNSSTLANAYVVSTAGVFGKLKQTSTLKPGRCYFNYAGTIASAKIDNATIEFMDEEGSIIDIITPNFDGEEATDIDGIITNSNVVSVQYISVNGQVSNEPVKGMNLVKKTYADGTVETSKIAY